MVKIMIAWTTKETSIVVLFRLLRASVDSIRFSNIVFPSFILTLQEQIDELLPRDGQYYYWHGVESR